MKFINNSPLGDLDVPALGRVVEEGETFDVPADIGASFAAQEFFEPADAEAVAAEKAAHAHLAEVNADLNPETGQGTPEPPAGNATTEAWAAWAIAAGLATVDEVAGLGREDIRQKYGPAPGVVDPKTTPDPTPPSSTETPAVDDVDGDGPPEDDPANADVSDDGTNTDEEDPA